LTLTSLGAGIAQAQAPHGAVIGWGQVVGGDGFTAMISGGDGAGLITLDPSGECSLELSGNVILNLTSAPGWDGDTAVQVNSNDPCALCGDGSSLTLIAPETNIVGMDPGYCFNDDATLDTIINTDSPVMPDPLGGLVSPPIGLSLGQINPSTDNPTYYPPGYYPGGMKISGSKKVLLGPGIYVVEGDGSNGGFQASGGASVVATNVMIYLKSGKFSLGSIGSTLITPMTEERYINSDYIGIAVFQARDNFTGARITGAANMTLEGTYYFPNNRLEIGGTGIQLGNQLIAWQLDLHGSGMFEIQYDGRFPVANCPNVSNPDQVDIGGDGICDTDGDGVPDEDDACPDSNLDSKILVGGCNTRITNQLLTGGCTMADVVSDCADNAHNHGKFVSCIARLANGWAQAGVIARNEIGRIVRCATHAGPPHRRPVTHKAHPTGRSKIPGLEESP